MESEHESVVYERELVVKLTRRKSAILEVKVEAGVVERLCGISFFVGNEGEGVFEAGGAEFFCTVENHVDFKFFVVRADAIGRLVGLVSRGAGERFVADVGGILAGSGGFAAEEPKNNQNYDDDER